MYDRLLVLMILGFIATTSFAQSEMPEKNVNAGDFARERIKQLEEGTVIVRLQSFHRKLESLKDLATSENLSSSQQDKMQEKYETTLSNRDDYNRRLMNSFKNHYNFSAVRFAYDTSFHDLSELDYSQLPLLNESLQPDAGIKINAYPVFILGYGNTDPSRTSGIESWVVHDKYMNALSRPFPYYVPAKGLPKKITYLVYNEEEEVYELRKKKEGKLKGTDRIVARWLRDLQLFYIDTHNYYKRTKAKK